MRIHQAGSHLMSGGRAKADDWSWRQTRRRLVALYRLARPYKLRTLIAILSLLAATAGSLAPPYLVGRTVGEGRHGHTSRLGWAVGAFLGAGGPGIALQH